MSDSRKYYYLKLKENFFDTDEMIVLESMPDGHLYSNILLKLYLRSLKNEGKLMFNDRIPFSSTMLAQVTRHSVGVIEKAMTVFKELNLVEVMDNGAIYMSDIQTFIGQSSTEADRIRAYRDKIKDEKSQQKQLVQMYDKCTPEIEIEKEIDIEKEIKDSCSPEASETAPKKKNLNKERFEEFWNTYPRKIGKKKAQEIYKKLNPNQELHNQIITAINQQKTSIDWTKENGQYIPHPTTWLNQGRWDDELEPGKENPNAKRETATTGKRLGIYL